MRTIATTATISPMGDVILDREVSAPLAPQYWGEPEI
jgi:hypothetical protein